MGAGASSWGGGRNLGNASCGEQMKGTRPCAKVFVVSSTVEHDDGPIVRTLAAATYPVILCVAVAGGALMLQAEVPSALITLASFVFMIGSGLLLEWWLPYNRAEGTKPSRAVEIINSAVNLVANSRLFGPPRSLLATLAKP